MLAGDQPTPAEAADDERPPWLAAFARIPVLINGGLLVFNAATYPALPAEVPHHSSGKCWAAWISALLFPAVATAAALLGSVALRFLGPELGRVLSHVLDFAAWTCAFIALYGVLGAASGFRCL